MLGMLRQYLGDAIFFNAVRYYGNTHAYSTATSYDLWKDFDTVSGKDLGWFFKPWVFGTGYAKDSIHWSKTPTGVPYADLSNPQTLNLYSYVKNNPLSAFDDDGHATIEIRYTSIGPGYTHSYIVVTDTNGARTYFRAGPSAGGPSSGSSGALSSASGGSSGQSSNSNSNSSNSSSPGSGPGGADANTGPFGALHADSGAYVPGTIDYETNPAASTTLLSNDQPASGYIDQLQSYSDNINNSNIPYNPLSTNSNAYAAGAANFLGLTVPKPPVNAPGSGTPLPVPPPAPPPPPPTPPCSVAGACPK